MREVDVASLISLTISVIVGSFIGHMIYDFYKTHKAHKENKKEKQVN